MNNKIPVIIDCDPGIDDSFALYYALNSPLLEVIGVVSVAGNVPLTQTTANACNLLAFANSDVPVFAGSDGPLIGLPIKTSRSHGSSGLGNFVFPDHNTDNLVEHQALERVAHLIETYERPITVVAIGPLTNVAKLMLVYPHLKTKIQQLVIMGGGIVSGNYSSSAEFNIASDPYAAKVVIDAGLNCTIVPLDTTETCHFNQAWLLALQASHASKANMLFEIVNSKTEVNLMKHDDIYFIHDLVAMLVVTKPEYFDFKEVHVDVELCGDITKGQTLFDQRTNRCQKPNCILASTDQFAQLRAHALKVLTSR